MPDGPPALLLPLAVIGVLLAVVLRFSALRLGNDDTWFHLVLGHAFRHGWNLSDPRGLTPFATSPWVPTQWSTEALASVFEDRFGLPGVAWLFGTCYAALVVGCYVSCRRLARPLAAAAATALLVLAVAPVLSARPQIISLLLLTVTAAAWLRSADDGRPRWWLVPMTWVWATAHGLWSAGVILGLACSIGVVLDRRLTLRRSLEVLAVPLLSMLAAALTPVGPRLLASQLAVSARTGMIAEWGPTTFRSVPSLAAAVMIGLVVLVWVRFGQRSWARTVLLVVAAGWTLLVVRMVPLGAVVVAPLLAESLERVLCAGESSRGSTLGRARARMDPVERAALSFAAIAYCVVLAVAAPHATPAAASAPDDFTGRLQALPTGSTVLVEDGVGSWIEWRTPGIHPVIDGMLDAYPVPYIRSFFAMTRLEPGWRTFVAKSEADVAVVEAETPLTSALERDLGWREVQRDGRWVFLVAPQPGSDVGEPTAQ